MKKITLFLMLLCAFVGVARAQETESLQLSTNVTNPEHVYYMRNGNGRWMNSNTAATQTWANVAKFVFVAGTKTGTGSETAVKIYCVTSQKWLTYAKADSYTEGTRDFVTLTDDENAAESWAATTMDGKGAIGNCYQFAPYNTTGAASRYMNWFQGPGSNPNDGTYTVGIYKDNAAADNGSIWLLTSVPTSGKYYLQEKGGTFVSLDDLGAEANDPNQNKLATLIFAPKAFEVTVTAEGKWRISNESGAYLGKSPSNRDWNSWVDADQSDFEWIVEGVVENGEFYYTLLSEAGKYLAPDANAAVEEPLYVNKEKALALRIKLLSGTEKLVKVTYSFMYNNAEKATQIELVKVGQAYPDINVEFPFGMSASKPAGNVADEDNDGVEKVEFNITENLPFAVAADYSSIAHWYYLNIRDDNSRTYLKYEDGVDYIKANDNRNTIDAATESEKDAYTWAFIGTDPFDGYQIVNRKTGASYILSAPVAPTGDKNADQLARMVESANVGTGNTVWNLKKPTHANASAGAFYVEHPTATSYAFNRQNQGTPSVATLCYWNQRDLGSGICAVERDIISKADLTSLISQAESCIANSGQIGCYSAASVESLNEPISNAQTINAKEDATEDEIADAVSALRSAIGALQVVTPAKGKFYRLKNAASGRYMADLSDADGKVLMSNAQGAYNQESRHTTVFYLDENNELLSFSNGCYVDCQNKNFAAVGTKHAGEFGIAYGGITPNVVTYKNNGRWTYGNVDNGAQIDRGQDTPNAAGYNWTFEEVEWLPVPMNESAGYATIYSPVQLECSSDRVEAYTVAPVGVGSTYVTLNKVDYVPANTGVILKYKSGVENGNVYLRIQATSEGTFDTALEGTYAATNIMKDAYVLSMPEGKEVGLYKALKNQNGDAAWKNNGFKAYLPAPASGAPMLTFDFGTETAIKGIEAAKQNGAIYDLSGRRVKAATKGIFIINGKKVIK